MRLRFWGIVKPTGVWDQFGDEFCDYVGVDEWDRFDPANMF